MRSRPVTALTAISISGTVQVLSDYRADDDMLIKVDGDRVFLGINSISVTYQAGFAVFPGSIKMAALRIAALLMAEGQGNIGFQSKSLDGQTKIFVNYTNYSKFLDTLSGLRIQKW